MGERSEAVGGLVLAAGASVRMKRPKLLLPIGKKILLETVLTAALGSDLDRVILVLGHRAEELRRALHGVLGHPKLEVIENPQYRKGISSSILAGLQLVEKEIEHLMVLLGDMPGVTAALINSLLRRYLDSGCPLGAVQVYGRRSHPVVFGRGLFGELHGLKGDVGARAVFERHMDQACLVEAGGTFDDTDIDTPQDYELLLRKKQAQDSRRKA